MLNRPLKRSWAMFKRCHLAKREEGAKQTERQVESREEMEQRVSVPSFASVSVHPPLLGEDREDRGRERESERTMPCCSMPTVCQGQQSRINP